MSSPNLQTRRRFLRFALGGAGMAAGGLGLTACGGGGGDVESREAPLKAFGAAAQSGPPAELDAPTLNCADGTTMTSINLTVSAGATGAPDGFSLHWMRKAEHDQYGWAAEFLCEAGFSGNANDSRYALAAGESVTVNIGEFLFDSGASTDCTEPLECGTEYVFRAFAHRQSGRDGLSKSAWSADAVCQTLPCAASCNYSQGYWKTHGPVPTGNNSNAWPATSLMLGTLMYQDGELLDILLTPAGGNGLVALAHQLIAAKLNVEKNGLPPTDDIIAADMLVGGLAVPPLGDGFLKPAVTSTLTEKLRIYNEGGAEGGPGHCA